MQQLRIADFIAAREAGHFARSVVRGDTEAARLHGHDFMEVFWIIAGSGYEITPDRVHPLAPGDLRLVRPQEVHGFSGDPRDPLRLANLAVPRWHWQQVMQHLGHEDPLRSSAERLHLRLDGSALSLLDRSAAGCERGRRDALAVDQVLLAVLSALRDQGHPGPAPSWFQDGLARFRSGGWRQGTPGLVAACGRSREHVARTCRQVLGRSPTQVLLEVRLQVLATSLTATGAPVLDLIQDAGFTNPTHAYRCFRTAYGCNPGAWRARQQRILGG